jgi:transcriptional regulator with XRE-family HTH domain
MDARGLNANQLAIRAGVAPAYFATAFKRNTRTVSQDQAKKLAPALGVRAAWLMSGEPPMTGPGDEPLPHVYDGSLKRKRRERKYGEKDRQTNAETSRERVE